MYNAKNVNKKTNINKIIFPTQIININNKNNTIKKIRKFLENYRCGAFRKLLLPREDKGGEGKALVLLFSQLGLRANPGTALGPLAGVTEGLTGFSFCI